MPLTSCQLISQTIESLSDILIEKLSNCYVTKNKNSSFTELIEAVGDINAVETNNADNIRPIYMPTFPLNEDDNYNGTLSSFLIRLDDRITYYMQLLGYLLILKGVPVELVNQQTDLRGLIELIDMIQVIDQSQLNLTYEESQYFGASIVIQYELKDKVTNEAITDGLITIQDNNGVIYPSVQVGDAISITPLSISEKENGEYKPLTFTLTYTGSDYHAPTSAEATVVICPSKINIQVDMTNITTYSRYYGSNKIGYETDEWTIDIKTYNHRNQPLANIPLSLSIAGSSWTAETDEEGNYSINRVIEQVGTQTLTCTTNYENTEEMSNNTVNYGVQIKYNIIQQDVNEYVDYTGKNAYTYEIKIVDEDSGQLTNEYNGDRVKVILGESIQETVVTNGKASYTFTSFNVGQKNIQWKLNKSGYSAQAMTYVNIKSNFVLPEDETYFLNDTPAIIYRPDGDIGAGHTVTGTITYNTTEYSDTMGTTQTQVIIGYETIETEDGELIDDPNKPIYETIDITDVNSTSSETHTHTDNITATTNNNGILNTISNYKNASIYTLILQSAYPSETQTFEYELKKPFDISLTEYNKKTHAKYTITIYDTEHNYYLEVRNKNNEVISPNVTVNTSGTYLTLVVYIEAQSQTIGTNTISCSLNGYSEATTFKLVNQVFTLQTESVALGEDTIYIKCNDSDITSINIQASNDDMEIENITYNDANSCFTINAIFKKAGVIPFTVIDESMSSESFNITVNKADLTCDAYVYSTHPQNYHTSKNNIAYIDKDTAQVHFSIDDVLYSNLPINYIITKQNTTLLQQSFIYYQDTEQNEHLQITLPTLDVGEYQIRFIYNGDNNYNSFNKIVDFTITDDNEVNTLAVVDMDIDENGDLVVEEMSIYDINKTNLLTDAVMVNNKDIEITIDKVNNPGETDKIINKVYIINDKDVMLHTLTDEGEE